jgi:uncharacterized protein
MRYARKRIVFDTSSLIPACLYPDRDAAQILRNAMISHEVFASTATFNELATVLSREKFNAWQPLALRLLWLQFFRQAVLFIEPSETIHECRDPKDNQFLELAIGANADVLVSSDIHLLELNPFRGVAILRLSEFKLGL